MENNHDSSVENLKGQEAIEKLNTLVEKAKTCFFCTGIKTGIPANAIPMTALEVDDRGNIWFISKKDSTKNKDIEQDPFTHLFFQGSTYSNFLSVYGISEIIIDQNKLDKLWDSSFNTWFESKEDPNITLIKLIPSEAHYWESKNGHLITLAQIALSGFLGEANDVGREGDLEI
ncbi:pyridoxamine 5'-phosphate oxidase-related FMN-binding protein [Pseudopedobacter saltans DSM 12145]|uniref:Pyridoxamine 5'-phosphate oxidase-related FMN-binding protein n=1 Tax=Pseudopedobacter saltans (strain ATCC 51119 / DSM 12145 / JCM 21818 / CCUG 39354 / LMG 10337 / NBRC 100064 / NCIMB 13643) TaxID=762903 RepID=F0SDQ7_PSESL|nr:pyridoxamine 5'-phosphate oxidase family protein [Pseudopedobacter saltans]ADY50784.1 pyridoxamine 5'-phosphate oxidase-related FMN-binding protein [Pseudopedobacter saltans DSM 12145]